MRISHTCIFLHLLDTSKICSFLPKKKLPIPTKRQEFHISRYETSSKNIKLFQQKFNVEKKDTLFSKNFKNYICLFSMETFAMTTLILAASLSRWQLHQEFLLEEKTECPPTDGPPKNHPHIPPKKSMSVYRKNVFVGSRAASCV